jgi:hypothetical protein
MPRKVRALIVAIGGKRRRAARGSLSGPGWSWLRGWRRAGGRDIRRLDLNSAVGTVRHHPLNAVAERLSFVVAALDVEVAVLLTLQDSASCQATQRDVDLSRAERPELREEIASPQAVFTARLNLDPVTE